jgi:ElaB/YqjD/DUF883 family membrane-anchored ribosome-binding protein
MATSEQLEREAEATRAQIAATLDELRGRLTTGQMVDQLVGYARESGGGEFVRNLGRQVVGNPLPVTLVGAGLAWLMMAGRRAGADGAGGHFATGSDTGEAGARAGERAADAADRLSTMGQAAQDAASDTMADIHQRVGEAGAGLQETANAAGAALRGTASTAYDAAAERSRQGADAVARGARSMREGAATGGKNVMTFLQEQPLVLAGIGLAIGALLGTSLPSTEVEDKLMGDASDAAKHDAKAFAEEQVDKGKAVAEQAWNAAKPEIDEQLHGGAPGSDSGGSATHASAGEATLVPADEANQTEMATDVARRETRPSSE